MYKNGVRFLFQVSEMFPWNQSMLYISDHVSDIFSLHGRTVTVVSRAYHQQGPQWRGDASWWCHEKTSSWPWEKGNMCGSRMQKTRGVFVHLFITEWVRFFMMDIIEWYRSRIAHGRTAVPFFFFIYILTGVHFVEPLSLSNTQHCATRDPLRFSHGFHPQISFCVRQAGQVWPGNGMKMAHIIYCNIAILKW